MRAEYVINEPDNYSDRPTQPLDYFSTQSADSYCGTGIRCPVRIRQARTHIVAGVYRSLVLNAVCLGSHSRLSIGTEYLPTTSTT